MRHLLYLDRVVALDVSQCRLQRIEVLLDLLELLEAPGIGDPDVLVEAVHLDDNNDNEDDKGSLHFKNKLNFP